MGRRDKMLNEVHHKVNDLLKRGPTKVRASAYLHLLAPILVHPWIVAAAILAAGVVAVFVGIGAIAVGLLVLAVLPTLVCYADPRLRHLVEVIRLTPPGLSKKKAYKYGNGPL